MSNIFSCATPIISDGTASQSKPSEVNSKEKVVSIESALGEKNKKFPKDLETVDFLNTTKYDRPAHTLAVQNSFWMFYYSRMEIVSKDAAKNIIYNSLDKDETVKILVYGNPLGTRFSTSPRGIWQIESEVILRASGYNLFHFKKDGTFTKKARTTDKWWELKHGEYAKYNWTVEYDNGAQLRFGHRKPIPKSNRRIPRKKILAYEFAFSGPWVLVTQTDIDHPLKKLVLVNRRTAEIVAEFKYCEWDENSKIRYDFRVHEKGFYIDRYEGYDEHHKITPVRWFGEKIIDLDHGPDVFCYVFKGAKKCLDNTGKKFHDVVEMENYRVLQTKKELYIEGFSEIK